MKKTYIAPKAKEYKVSTVDLMATSPGLNNRMGNGVQLVKGQEEDLEMEDGDNTVSIWDLY